MPYTRSPRPSCFTFSAHWSVCRFLRMPAACGRSKIIAPEGTIVNALPPAAVCGGNVETSTRIVDVLYKCLAKAMPIGFPRPARAR